MRNLALICYSVVANLILSVPVLAQITPDATVGTQVTRDVNINGILSDRIDKGLIDGANLFHSFSEFNINAGRGVYFSNPDGVSNIFTRVTGANPSQINGTLGVLGNANLFFMNPNGIVFGSGAQLDLKGSFLGTTASSINFADGTQFSANNVQPAPVLTVTVPVGLGFGSQPGKIEVYGQGNNATFVSLFQVFQRNTNATGLKVLPGNTLALVGGDISVVGGVFTAESGQISLGSVGGGEVSLNPDLMGWRLGYEKAASFQDINISQNGYFDTTGFNPGGINFQANRITFSDRSIAIIQNFGSQVSGNISLTATESVKMIANDINNPLLVTEVTGTAKAGDIIVSTGQFILENGSAVVSRTASSARGGDIIVNAADSVELTGFALSAPSIHSSFDALVIGSGNGGNITINTQHLRVSNGATIGATTFGEGNAGSLTVNASDFVALSGSQQSFIGGTIIGSEAYKKGNAGIVTINTGSLFLQDGTRISSSTFNSGNAGEVIVNASELVQLNGRQLGTAATPAAIESAAEMFPSAFVRQFLGIPDTPPSGAAGSVTVNTPELRIGDGARLTVRNGGLSNAGNILVNTNNLYLDPQGLIVASTASGEGGNITLNVKNALLARNQSTISAEAGGTGNGGNITINAGAIAQLENSNITANAFQGNGGNIQITTQGIFASPDSNITASSQLGISGDVNISTPEVNQESALVPQTSNFISTDQVVASSCLANRNVNQGRFVVTGNGGLPENPHNNLEIPYSVVQVRSTVAQTEAMKSQNSLSPRPWKLGDKIVEATHIVTTADGRLLLTPTPAVDNTQSLTCPTF